MEGFVLLDSRGRKLTRNCYWSQKDYAGWVWSLEEANRVIQRAAHQHWKYPPMYFQHCIVLWNEDNSDNQVYGLEDPQRI